MNKDCQIIFTNKQTYDFSSNDIVKALEYCKDKPVFAIRTPWGVLSIMDDKCFDTVYDAVMNPTEADPGYLGEAA